MKGLNEQIHYTDWDNLIVLDACRYDYFAQFYDIFPNLTTGDLQPVYSPGQATPETLIECFDGVYDWEFASAHPWINDHDKPIGPEKTQDHLPGYDAGAHFKNIHNIWDLADDNPGSAHPSSVKEYVLANRPTFRDNKSIIWFMDPHEPHVGTVQVRTGGYFPWEGFEDEDGNLMPGLIKMLRTSYKFNLLNVLYHVMELVGVLEGKTIITSDHGEMMFHGGSDKTWYGHGDKKDIPALRQVPWLELHEADMQNIYELSNDEFLDLAYQTVLDRPVREEGRDVYLPKLNDGMGRKRLLEILLHSGEYRQNIDDPNKFGTADTQFDGDAAEERDLDDKVEEQLRDLGYK